MQARPRRRIEAQLYHPSHGTQSVELGMIAVYMDDARELQSYMIGLQAESSVTFSRVLGSLLSNLGRLARPRLLEDGSRRLHPISPKQLLVSAWRKNAKARIVAVKVPVACSAKCNQIFVAIIPEPASRLDMVNLQIV